MMQIQAGGNEGSARTLCVPFPCLARAPSQRAVEPELHLRPALRKKQGNARRRSFAPSAPWLGLAETRSGAPQLTQPSKTSGCFWYGLLPRSPRAEAPTTALPRRCAPQTRIEETVKRQNKLNDRADGAVTAANRGDHSDESTRLLRQLEAEA